MTPLFLHGFLGSEKDAPRGAQGITLPGHAFSPALEGDDWFEKTLTWLKPQLTGAPLIGYSLGGRLALLAALRLPQLVPKALIISAHPGLFSSEEREERIKKDEATASKLLEEGLPQFLQNWYAQPLFATLTMSPMVYQRRLHHRPEDLAKALLGYSLGRQPSLWEEIQGHTDRLHFIYGEEDLSYAPIAAALSSIASVSLVKEAGHALHLEQTPYFEDLCTQLF